MYSAMLSLVRDSDLSGEQKQALLQCYKDGDRAEFLGRAFLVLCQYFGHKKSNFFMLHF